MTGPTPEVGDETLRRVARLVYHVLDEPPELVDLGPGDRLGDLGVASAQILQIVMTIEQSFGLEFPDSVLTPSTFTSIGSLAGVVDSLLREDQ